MNMIRFFTGLAMFLTIVVLLLLILILSIILQKLLVLKGENSIVIKIEKYSLQKKTEKRKKRHKKGKKHKLRIPQLPHYDEENRDIDHVQQEKQETGVWESVKLQEPLHKEGEENACAGIRIKIVDPNSLIQTGGKIQFEENINGNMVICGKKGEEFLVKPVASSIGEKDYKFAALGNCFEINQEIKSGCVYKITEVRQPCRMKKENGNYTVSIKGVLCIEQEDG